MLIAALKAWKDLSTYTLFENHFPFQKSVFRHSKYILGDKLDNYVQKFETRGPMVL